MKNMKKILALLVAVLMIVASVSALADHNITTTSTTHTYEIYQILTGTVQEGKLTSLKYGADTKGEGRTTGSAVSKADIDTLASYTDAGGTQALDQQDIAFIAQFVNVDGTPFAKVGKGAGESGADTTSVSVPEGYYLIKDVDNSLANTNDQYTLYIQEVVSGDLAITPKTGTTTHDKKTGDVNDSDGTSASDQDSGDYDIGDYVPYTLTAHMAQNVNAYKQYHLTFEDTLETGSFDDITTPVIKIDGTPIANVTGYNATLNYTVQPTAAGFTVTVNFTPAGSDTLLPAALNGKDVTVEFSARLAETAKIGVEGNENTFVLKYSNNPNDDDGGDEGTTPGDTVITFTYQLTVNKKDEAGQDLDGATFTLYKKYTAAQLTAAGKTAVETITYGNNKSYTIAEGDKWVQVKQIVGTSAHTFEFKGLDDGDYLLVETAAPTNYNPIAPQEFTITANHVTSWTTQQRTEMLTSVEAAAKDGSTITFTNGTNTNIGKISTDVTNKSGTQLPSTGGMGTTILYIGGSILVLAAAILLITKRRMNAND